MPNALRAETVISGASRGNMPALFEVVSLILFFRFLAVILR
jgi:hypothetical protein